MTKWGFVSTRLRSNDGALWALRTFADYKIRSVRPNSLVAILVATCSGNLCILLHCHARSDVNETRVNTGDSALTRFARCRCKMLKKGLKIRRPLPAVGVQVPLWAP